MRIFGGRHQISWGVAPGYVEYRLWRSNNEKTFGHRPDWTTNLANGHFQRSQGHRPWNRNHTEYNWPSAIVKL